MHDWELIQLSYKLYWSLVWKCKNCKVTRDETASDEEELLRLGVWDAERGAPLGFELDTSSSWRKIETQVDDK